MLSNGNAAILYILSGLCCLLVMAAEFILAVGPLCGLSVKMWFQASKSISSFVLLPAVGLTVLILFLIVFVNLRLVSLLKAKLKMNSERISVVIPVAVASVFLLFLAAEITLVGAVLALCALFIAEMFTSAANQPQLVLYLSMAFLTMITVPVGYGNVFLAHKMAQNLFEKSTWLMAWITTLGWGALLVLMLLGKEINLTMAIMIAATIAGAWIAAFHLSGTSRATEIATKQEQ